MFTIPDRPRLPFASRRSTVYATRGMVASSQPLASQVGLEILMAGGNAADAAVAVAAALNVTEPTSTGIGGDAFVLYYDASDHKVSAINGSGCAPAALSLESLKERGIDQDQPWDRFHALTVSVPGACAAWCDTIDRFGMLELSQVFAPAIRLADEGFPVAPLTAYYWGRGVEFQLSQAEFGHEMLIEGRAPVAGEIMRNPSFADTLRKVADGGKDAYYRGDIAERIVQVLNTCGGVITLEDLAMHESKFEEAISTVYQGVRLHECPPNGQGLTALLALNILSQFDLPPDPLSAARLHLLIETMRLAFADASWYIADPAHVDIPIDELLSEEYAAQRATLIDPERATTNQVFGLPLSNESDTVYFSVVDGQGNACSFINSNYMGFGTGIVPEGCGFTLQNRGFNFSLDPDHPNAVAPGKRPYNTIIPGMATREADGSLYACMGVMGGFMQPQGHVQVLLNLVANGLDPQAALDHPRICLEEGGPEATVALEEGIPLHVMAQLAEMGHPVRPTTDFGRTIFGRGQVIIFDPETGVLAGGSDPRADGLAIGF